MRPYRSHWYKSSHSASESQCVEVAESPHTIAIRDSKHPEWSLAFPAGQWRAFVSSLKDGEFDR